MLAGARRSDPTGDQAAPAEAATDDAPYGAAAAAPIKEARIAADAGRRLPVIVNLGYPRGTVAVPLPLNSGARAVRAGSSAKAAVRAPHFHYPGRAGAAAESAKSALGAPAPAKGVQGIPPGDDASAPAAPERKKGRCRGWSRQRPLPGMEKSGNDNRIRSTVARHRDPEPDAEGGRGDRNRR